MLDKHIVKMPTETCQMLHTNALFNEFTDRYGYEPSLRRLKEYYEETKSILMKPAMLNHPSTIWANKTMITHYGCLSMVLHCVWSLPKDMVKNMVVMSEYYKRLWSLMQIETCYTCINRHVYEYRIPNKYGKYCWEYVIDSYRHYLEGKWRFAEWRNDRKPNWWPNNHYKNKYNEEILAFNKAFGANLKLM